MSERNSKGEDIEVDEVKEFVGNSGVKITEEEGKSKIAFDFASLPEITTELDPATDYTLIYDASAAAHKKALIQDLPSSASSVATFQLDQQVFSTAGAHTWTKPAGAKAVYVLIGGAGGGGGGGRRGAAGTGRRGGQGGGGGGTNELWFDAAALPSTVTVTVGAGGTAGAAATVDSTNGGAGGTGGMTSFGDYIRADSGAGGPGGIQSTSTGSSTAGGTIVWNGAAGGTSTNGTGHAGGINLWGGGGGGGGGGISATNVRYNGGVGGYCQSDPALANAAGGGDGAAGGNGTNNSSIPWFGNGGAGGGASVTVAGGAGGNGGNCAGGGGGGASANGFDSGAGGTGGDGMVIVLSFF